MSEPVAEWLKAIAGDYGFPWVTKMLSSSVLVIFLFGGVMYLFDDSSARNGEYYISAIAFPLLILLTFLCFRALIFARRLRISNAGLEVRPLGIVISADEIIAIQAIESDRRLKLSVEVAAIVPRYYLPGYLNPKRNSYELRLVKR